MSVNINNVEAKSGAFYVTDANGETQKVDLGTLMMMLNLDRVSNLDKQIETQIQEISERNSTIKEMTEFMSALRKMKADGTSDKKTIQVEEEVPLSDLTEVPSPELFQPTGCTKVKVGDKEYYAPSTSKVKDGKVYKTVDKEISADLTINGQTKPLYGDGSWSGKFGIDWTDAGGARPSKDGTAKDLWNQTFETNINAIKSKIDMLNNDSQMDNIKLQNLLEKRSNSFEMATKVMDTNKQSVQSILRNL